MINHAESIEDILVHIHDRGGEDENTKLGSDSSRRSRPKRIHRSGHSDEGVHPTPLVALAARGYVVAKPETMKAAGETFGFIRFVISDSGRTVIG